MDFFKSFDINRFIESLQYMWKGMLCIFIVIAVIILFIFGMNKIMTSLEERKKAKQENADNN